MTISKTNITQWPYPLPKQADWALFFAIKNSAGDDLEDIDKCSMCNREECICE